MDDSNKRPRSYQVSKSSLKNNFHFLFPKGENIYYDYTKYLRNDLFKNVFNEKEDVNLIADMNSGKTFSIINYAHKKKIKLLLLQPLQINVKQKAAEFLQKGIKVGVIHGKQDSTLKEIESRRSEVNSILSDKDIYVILCVYNSLYKLIDNDLFCSSQYTIVVDEAHLLVTQYSFRSKEINFIIKNLNNFKQTIYLTGTPEGAILNTHKNYICKSLSNHVPHAEIKIVKYKKEGMFKLFTTIVNNISLNFNHYIVVLKDDIKQLYKLRAALIKYGLKKSTIKILHSGEKESDEFIYLENEQKIPDEINILLTTRVLADGANIYTYRKVDIYCLDVEDFSLKRQFISRFRNGVNRVYDFLSYKYEESLPYLDFMGEFGKLLNSFEEKARIENEFISISNYSIRKRKINRFASSSKSYTEMYDGFLFRFSRNGNWIISHEKIGQFLHEKFNERLVTDSFQALEFYVKIGKYLVAVMSYDELFESFDCPIKSFSLDNFREATKFNLYDDNSIEQVFILDNFSFLYSEYCKDKGINLFISFIDPKFFSFNIEKTKNIEKIRRLLRKRSLINSFNKIHELVIVGYPFDIVKQLFELLYSGRNVKYDAIIKTFNFYFALKTTEFFPEILKFYEHNAIFSYYNVVFDVYTKYKDNSKIYLEATRIDIKSIMNKYDLTVSSNSTEYQRILNGIFILSERRQERRKNKNKYLKPKYHVKYYFNLKGPQVISNLLVKFKIHHNNSEIFQFEKIKYNILRNQIYQLAYQNNTLDFIDFRKIVEN